MRKTISAKWLTQIEACPEVVEELEGQRERNSLKVLELLIKKDKLDWANWLIVRVMEHKQYVAYAIYATEQVIDVFEKEYPNDKRPYQVLESAKKWLRNSTTKNRQVAYEMVYTAYAVVDATTHVAYRVAQAVAHTVYAVADMNADAACMAADAVVNAAYMMAADVVDMADEVAVNMAIQKEMRLKILRYGLKILEEEKRKKVHMKWYEDKVYQLMCEKAV